MKTVKKAPATKADRKRAEAFIEPKPLSEIEKIRKRKPLRDMFAKGKDPLEATLICVVNELLDRMNCDEEEGFLFATFSAEQQARQRSLKATADRIVEELEKSEHPEVYFYDPILADYWKEIHYRDLDLSIHLTNLSTILARHPKLKSINGFKKELREETQGTFKLVNDVLEDRERLYLTIGFLMGARAYRTELTGNLDALKFNIMEKFTIKAPEPAAGESPSIAAVAS